MGKVRFLFMGILFGVIFGGMIWGIELLSNRVPFSNFLVDILLIVIMEYAYILYFFVKKHNSKYALICVPSTFVFLIIFCELFDGLLSEEAVYMKIGAMLMFVFSPFVTSIIVLITLIIKRCVAGYKKTKC